jgi:hypothetical protein
VRDHTEESLTEVKKWRTLFYEDSEAPRGNGKKEGRKGDAGNL